MEHEMESVYGQLPYCSTVHHLPIQTPTTLTPNIEAVPLLKLLYKEDVILGCGGDALGGPPPTL